MLHFPSRERKCTICGKYFLGRRKQKYCSKECRNKAISRSTKDWIYRVWGVSNAPNSLIIGKRAEKYVAEEILPALGFSNILVYAGNGPIDIFCEKGGEKYAIEVTTRPQYKLTYKKRAFLDWFKLKLMVCHLKPDFSWYILKELNGESSYCLTDYLRGRGGKL